MKLELDKRLMQDITDRLTKKNLVNPKWLAMRARMHLADLTKQDTAALAELNYNGEDMEDGMIHDNVYLASVQMRRHVQ